MIRIDRVRRAGAIAALLPLPLLFSHPAVAADSADASAAAAPAAAAAADGGDDNKIAEIVVTAQRREEKLQKVPIAVTAMDSKQIENRGIQNVGDLSALAPGLQISKTASNTTISQITIRGLSQINPAIYWDPAVGVYVDGVYIGKAQGGIFDIVDLERVEVLRGPQGTLYGRNTLAGAINLITRRPSGEFGGSASLEVGNYNAITEKASIDLPKIGIVSMSLAARQEQRDGWVKTSNDSSTSKLNDRNNNGLRFAADFDFAPDVLGEYRYDRSITNQTPNWDQLYHVDNNLGYPGFDGYASHDRLKHADLDAPMFEKAHISGHAFTLNWTLDDINTLKSITGYRKLSWDDSLDLDGSPYDIAFTQRFTKYHQISQDLQWLGHTDQLNWVGGLYYFGDNGGTNNPQHFFSHSSNYDSSYSTKTHAGSVYGQLDYKPIDPLTLSAGLRYTREKKELARTFGCNSPFYPECTNSDPAAFNYLIPAGTGAQKTFHATTPMASVAWQFTPDLNAYLRYAEGFKSGGFNGEFSDPTLSSADNVAETQTPFKPEKQRSYELGTKSTWLDQRIVLNAAVYYNKAKDLQESIFLGSGAAASSVRNAGKATIYGAELEGQVALWAGSRLGFNYAYLHTKYDEFIDGGADVADNRAFVHAPKNTANLYLDMRLAQLGWAELRGMVDYAYTDAFYTYAYQLTGPSDAGYDPSKQVASDAKVPSTGLLNLRLSLSKVKLGDAASGELALWCRNVTDKDSPTNFIDFGPAFGSLTVANFNDPRTFGVTGVVRW
ncbi:TonB-dependent receptor [Solimonas terrae]|uniref:TonB-dependent receptor n=1 Tax=Solimonas terrae TaxID=1396819 RepID=A0A6M2BRE1_9GAMM|nr:TonB-dependent receptor [Solimonas terrae]NGY04815.1 TonB-dependent receptor [Solimonas terrae]